MLPGEGPEGGQLAAPLLHTLALLPEPVDTRLAELMLEWGCRVWAPKLVPGSWDRFWQLSFLTYVPGAPQLN